jgi:hypothetical protein
MQLISAQSTNGEGHRGENAGANLHRLCLVRVVAPSGLQERLMPRDSYQNRVKSMTLSMAQPLDTAVRTLRRRILLLAGRLLDLAARNL